MRQNWSYLHIPQYKGPGLWRILNDPGTLRTQDIRRPKTLEDPGY